MIKEFINGVKEGRIDVVEHTHKILEEAKKSGYFNYVSEELALEQANALKKANKKDNSRKNKALFGIPVSVKDCICVKNVESTAGSRILKGYKPVKNAEAVQKAISQGAIIIGKTAQDEFGFGSFCTNVGLGFKVPKNPLDNTRCTGGSSGGAAGFTKICKSVHVAMAESTGGSIACPAAYCGVFGLTPTYGLVSRYGLIDYANSLDKIGAMSKNLEDAFLLLEIVKGKDKKDSTSLNSTSLKEKKASSEVKKIGIISNFFDQSDETVKKECWKKVKELEGKGVRYEEVKLPLACKYSTEVYYIIAMAEASTNLAKYCGMRYGAEEELEGRFNEYFSKVRSGHFGKETKRRLILGTFLRMAGYREAYYMKAMKARTLIIEEYKKVFKEYDAILHPTMPNIAPRFSEIEELTPMQNYMMDVMTSGPNLAGLPHLSIPVKKDKMPIGIMAIADHFNEEKLKTLGGVFDAH